MKHLVVILLLVFAPLTSLNQVYRKMSFLRDKTVTLYGANRTYDLKIQKNESFFVKVVKEGKYIFIQPDSVTRAVTTDQKIGILNASQKNFLTFELQDLLKFDTITRKNIIVSFPKIKDQYHLDKLVIFNNQKVKIASIRNNNTFPLPKSGLLFVLKIDDWPAFIVILDTVVNKKFQVKPIVVQKSNPTYYDDSVRIMNNFTWHQLTGCDASPENIKVFCEKNNLQVPDTILNKIAVARKYDANQCYDRLFFFYVFICVFGLGILAAGFLIVRFKMGAKFLFFMPTFKTTGQSEVITENFEQDSLPEFLKRVKEKHYKNDKNIQSEDDVLQVLKELNPNKLKKLLTKCNPTFKIENLSAINTSLDLPFIPFFRNERFGVKRIIPKPMRHSPALETSGLIKYEDSDKQSQSQVTDYSSLNKEMYKEMQNERAWLAAKIETLEKLEDSMIKRRDSGRVDYEVMHQILSLTKEYRNELEKVKADKSQFWNHTTEKVSDFTTVLHKFESRFDNGIHLLELMNERIMKSLPRPGIDHIPGASGLEEWKISVFEKIDSIDTRIARIEELYYKIQNKLDNL